MSILRIEHVINLKKVHRKGKERDKDYGGFMATKKPDRPFKILEITWIAWGYDYLDLSIIDDFGRYIYPADAKTHMIKPGEVEGRKFTVVGRKLEHHSIQEVPRTFAIEFSVQTF